jgi:hypothetical protein
MGIGQRSEWPKNHDSINGNGNTLLCADAGYGIYRAFHSMEEKEQVLKLTAVSPSKFKDGTDRLYRNVGNKLLHAA